MNEGYEICFQARQPKPEPVCVKAVKANQLKHC